MGGIPRLRVGSRRSILDRGNDKFKNTKKALAGVAQWIECPPVNQKVTGFTPSQSTCLGCRPGSPMGAITAHFSDHGTDQKGQKNERYIKEKEITAEQSSSGSQGWDLVPR